MFDAAKRREFRPRAVLFDCWYSGLGEPEAGLRPRLELLDSAGDQPLGGSRSRGLTAVRELPIATAGTVVHLKGFGPIRVSKAVSRDGDVEYWATNDLAMDELRRLELAERSWAVEEYDQALKQRSNIERCQARSSRAQRNHIGMAIRRFTRLSWYFDTTGVSWYKAIQACQA